MTKKKEGGAKSPHQMLINTIAREHGLTQSKARRVIFDYLERVARETVIRDRFSVPQFGTFQRRTRKARNIADPRTRFESVIHIPASVSIRFRYGKTGLFAKYFERAYWTKEPIE